MRRIIFATKRAAASPSFTFELRERGHMERNLGIADGERTLRLLQSKNDGYKQYPYPAAKQKIKTDITRYRVFENRHDKNKKEEDKNGRNHFTAEAGSFEGKNGTFVRKRRKDILQLDCENAKNSP